MTVESDVMFMNRIPFLVSFLIGANFTMVEYVSQRSKTVLTNSIGKEFQFYKNNGYNIKKLLMDRNFECIRDSLSEEANLNTIATNVHVPEIERKNRIIKDWARELIITFTSKKIPGRIIIKLIQFMGIWFNQESLENWILDVYYPQNIIMGQDLTYDKH